MISDEKNGQLEIVSSITSTTTKSYETNFICKNGSKSHTLIGKAHQEEKDKMTSSDQYFSH